MKRLILLLCTVFCMQPVWAQTTIVRYPINWTGQFHGSWLYSFGDMTIDKGVTYFSLQNNNKGHTPGTSPAYWEKGPNTPPPVQKPKPVPSGPGLPLAVAHVGTVGGTTTATDTTGGNFGLVCAPQNNVVQDSNNNIWQPIAASAVNGYDGTNLQMYASYNMHTSTAHTFTVSNNVPFTVQVFSNIASIDQIAVQANGAYPQVVGPITPTRTNEVIIGCTDGHMNPTPVPAGQSNVLTVNGPYVLDDFEVIPRAIGWPDGIGDAYSLLPIPMSTSIAFNATQRNGQVSSIASFFSVSDPAPVAVTFIDPVPEGALNMPYADKICPKTTGGIQPFNFLVSGLPAGMAYDKSTGCFASSAPTNTATDSVVTIQVTDANNKVASASTHLSVAQLPLFLSGAACPVATQLKPYSCAALKAYGGIGPLVYQTSSDPSFESLPGGMMLNAQTGALTSSLVMDQGDYDNVGFSVCDTHGGCATTSSPILINGDNSALLKYNFPKDSVWHLKASMLPDDTSIRSKIPTYYSGVSLQAEFGKGDGTGGLVINTYAANTPFVPVRSAAGGNQFTSGPIPCTAGMEGDRNAIPVSEQNGEPDMHTLGIYIPGTGADGKQHGAVLYEMYNVYPIIDASGNCSWGNPKDPNGQGYGSSVMPHLSNDITTSYDMPFPGATTDAAGQLRTIDLLTYDEVLGTGTPGAEKGVITHPLVLTVAKLGQFYAFPGTASAPVIHDNCPQPGYGTGDIQPWDQAKPVACFDGSGNAITTTGNTTTVAGMVFHYPLSLPEPQACSSNPVNHIIFTALRDYGFKAVDNGLNGRVMGTKDHRWPAIDTLNGCLRSMQMGQFIAPNVSVAAADKTYKSSKILPQYVPAAVPKKAASHKK